MTRCAPGPRLIYGGSFQDPQTAGVLLGVWPLLTGGRENIRNTLTFYTSGLYM